MSATPRTDEVWKTGANILKHAKALEIELTEAARAPGALELQAMDRKITELEAEVAKWKSRFISLGAAAAQRYGTERWGDNCLHYLHYDMLEQAGARMDDFCRCGDDGDVPKQGGVPP